MATDIAVYQSTNISHHNMEVEDSPRANNSSGSSDQWSVVPSITNQLNAVLFLGRWERARTIYRRGKRKLRSGKVRKLCGSKCQKSGHFPAKCPTRASYETGHEAAACSNAICCREKGHRVGRFPLTAHDRKWVNCSADMEARSEAGFTSSLVVVRLVE